MERRSRDDQREQEGKDPSLKGGIEQISRETMRRTEKPDGVRGGAEEKGTDKEEGENRRTGKGRRNPGKRCPILE